MSRYVVGIDLGTTHCAIAYADAKKGDRAKVTSLDVPQYVAAGEVGAEPLLPSVRYHPGEHENLQPLDDRKYIDGRWANALGAKTPARFVASAKSWLSHSGVDASSAILPWGAPAGVEKVSPVEASAGYLRHLAAAWSRAFPDAPLDQQDLTLTIPASFDERARALTLQAAKDAGLKKPRLVEEPLAAFYAWLHDQEDTSAALEGCKLAVVVDVGGGTTDFTLVKIEIRESGPRLTRIAVGKHILLGGDNMDLALAKMLEPQIADGGELNATRFAALAGYARRAKEAFFEAPEDGLTVTMPSGGSRIFAGTKTASLSRDQVEALLLDGFFPNSPLDATPKLGSSGIVAFGLPYAADPAITKHLAQFLRANESLCREALGADHDGPAVPDVLLTNGGVFEAAALRTRLLDVLSAWRGAAVRELHTRAPERAVAEGATAYALARRGHGLKISAGSARSYFLVLHDQDEAICILPRGTEEAEEQRMGERKFSLRVGKPVRFSLASSTSDLRQHQPGDLVKLDEQYEALPPLATVIDTGSEETIGDVEVELVAALTEIGTIELACIDTSRRDRRWKLEFQTRGTSGAIAHTTTLHPRFAEGVELIRTAYGKSTKEVNPRAVKTLRADLERIFGDRSSWETALLRELFGALLAGAKRRRRSAAHERTWFNLAGYCLRPGHGYPLDEWRIDQLWPLFSQDVQFIPDTPNWASWWIMWRRVAGGLSSEQQRALAESVEWYLHLPGPRPRKKPPGPKRLAVDDMIRMVGALERLTPAKKVELGELLLLRTKARDEPTSWWALGRLGARVPLYGEVHEVVGREVAEAWLDACLAQRWSDAHAEALCATLLARRSGDRVRDVSDTLRQRVIERLQEAGAPRAWVELIRTPSEVTRDDATKIYGDSLPPGLRLL